MDPAALGALCLLLAQDAGPNSSAIDPSCHLPKPGPSPNLKSFFAGRASSEAARDAIARVAYAEAGNQGDSGLAAVVQTILNRLQDGRWGDSVDMVLNSPRQFEPVMRSGGNWRRLPPVSNVQKAHVDTILNLILDSRLEDFTHGAHFFQNPALVANRANKHVASADLINFGGAQPSAVIGAHSFYVEMERGGASHGRRREIPTRASRLSPDPIFVDVDRSQRASGSTSGGGELLSTNPQNLNGEIFVSDVVENTRHP